MAVRLITTCALILAFSLRLAADCGLLPPPCQAWARATLVFYGEVLESAFTPNYVKPGEDSTDGRQQVKFKVLQAVKGVENGELTATFNITSEAVSFKPGGQYLVYASQREGQWETVCSRTKKISKPTELDELAELRKSHQWEPPITPVDTLIAGT
jgi:hypothetical protein